MAVGDLQEAREYISRVVPWPEPGQPGYVNVHWSYKDPAKQGGKGWTGRACQSVNEVERTVEWASKNADTLDIYACMSLQAVTETKTSKNGKTTYNRAIRNAANVISLKSLFLDLDAKGNDDNSYASINDMLDAFVNFLVKTNMPRPSVKVATGGGLHVYWVFDRALTLSEWQPLAFALVEATRQTGLKLDTQCTIDSVRILRIPGTLNNKLATPREVKFSGPRVEFNYSYEKISAILEPYKNALPTSVRALSSTIDTTLFPVLPSVKDKLSQGIGKEEYPPVELARVLPECGFLREAVTSGGKDYANPLWNLTTLLATFTDGGIKDAIIMGRKHPGFTIESTEALFDRKLNESKERGIGWPHCQTISATGSGPCKTCVHLTKGKTPFHFQVPKPQNAPQVAIAAPVGASGVPGVVPGVPILPPNADVPTGYSRDVFGIVHKEAVTKEGEQITYPICHYPMMQPWLQSNPNALHFSTRTHRDAQITILSKDIGTNEMRKLLQDQYLMLHTHEIKLIGDFFVSWVQKLKATSGAVVSTTPFGWNVAAGSLEGFVYGGNLWKPTGFRVAPSPDPELVDQYSPTGTIDPWIRAAKLITDQERPDLNAILASSFAAPLVRFTGHDGFVLSLWSSATGIGKTTAMRTALAVWGDPVRAMQQLTDTANSVFSKIGALRSLPLFWDELKTEEDTKRYVSNVFQMTSGKEKSRLTSQVKLRAAGRWQTLLISASNDSILELVASRVRHSDAGIMRVFEVEVKPGVTGQISVGVAQQALAELNDNYGNAGMGYAKYLGANFVAVQKELVEETARIEKLTNATADERFWISLVATLIIGAKLANRLGFTTINEPEFEKWCLEQLDVQRSGRKSSTNDMTKTINVSDTLTRFLSDMGVRHTLKTNKIWTSAGRPPPNAIMVRQNAQNKDSIYVQIGIEDKLIRISSAALSKWCKENEEKRNVLGASLKDKFGARIVNGHLCSGTSFGQAMGYIIEIDGGPYAELEYLFDI